MNQDLRQLDIILWVEDDPDLIHSLTSKINEVAQPHGCIVISKMNLAAGREFIENNLGRIRMVLLDLDLPRGDEPGTAGAPVGLELLTDFGHLPVIVLTRNSQMVGLGELGCTPMAWLKKGSNSKQILTFIDDALKISQGIDLGLRPSRKNHRTLVCVEYRLQNYSRREAEPRNPVPWEVLGLNDALNLLASAVTKQGGRVIAVTGCCVFAEFPGHGVDPDHFRSALWAIREAWKGSFGQVGSHSEFGTWYKPPFAVGMLPNHVNLIEKLSGGPYPQLHSLGRPGELVRRIASGLKAGEMGLIGDWLDPQSPEVKAWQDVPTALKTVNHTLPFMREEVTIQKKEIPR